MNQLKFVTGEAALLAGKTLVISDLHIGIEHEYRQAGISIPSQLEDMRKRLEKLIKETKPEKLILLGDIKHKVPGTSFQEEKEIPEFFSWLSGKVPVEITPGNHDPGIEKMLPSGIELHPTSGFLDGSFYYSHGHTWPKEEFFKAKYIITGHVQPQIEFRDSLGYRWTEKVWVISKLKLQAVKKKFRVCETKNLPELIIMPAFNRFSGGYSLNSCEAKERKRAFSNPITSLTDMNKAKIYLLDGTYLGELESLTQQPFP